MHNEATKVYLAAAAAALDWDVPAELVVTVGAGHIWGDAGQAAL